jgi:hypothetical protein
MKGKIITYLHTVKNLKLKQVFYRLYYFVYKRDKTKQIRFSSCKNFTLKMEDSILSHKSYLGDNTFSFLNQSYSFKGAIDWNYTGYGMLWAYNLNYFEFLHQPDFDKETGLNLINDYIEQWKNIRIGFDSYPISLRNIFWIRFLTKYSIKDKRIDSFLYDEYKILSKHLEFHLLGNHLLENAFSLLFGAYYFHDEKLYRKACKLLKRELKEQILSDGAHFELSPMYHQIILYRLLDCANLLSKNPWKNDDLFDFISKKISIMLSWLANMTFPSGNISYLNDSSKHIAPTSDELFNYARRLNITYSEITLSNSNYRLFEDTNYKCIIDIGGVEPVYQPGHAHADTFNFVLEVNKQPVFVDTGCSTYEQGSVRLFERGTSAHNTVTVNNLDSSQVWASHRIGKRAKVTILEDKPDKIVAQHNGYLHVGKIHCRTFIQDNRSIRIIDEIKGINPVSRNIALFHLDHSINDINIKDNSIDILGIRLLFKGASNIYMEEYEQAICFNQRVKSKCICVDFTDFLKTEIIFKD